MSERIDRAHEPLNKKTYNFSLRVTRVTQLRAQPTRATGLMAFLDGMESNDPTT